VEKPVIEETPVTEEVFIVEEPVIEEIPVIVTDGLLDATPPVFEESNQVTEELPVYDNEEEKKK